MADSNFVTLAELKDHCRVDFADDDALLETYKLAAIAHAENFINRPIVDRQVTEAVGCFAETIPLKTAEVQSVDEITYFDADNQAQILDPSAYVLQGFTDFDVKIASPLPETAPRGDAVRIALSAGMVAVPASLRAAILLIVGTLYEIRENDVTGTIVAQHSMSYNRLLWPHRRIPV